jgi:hypothetical protein
MSIDEIHTVLQNRASTGSTIGDIPGASLFMTKDAEDAE